MLPCQCLLTVTACFSMPESTDGASLTFNVDAARCIDLYIEQRVAAAEGKADAPAIDDHLTAIVERMFERYQTPFRLGHGPSRLDVRLVMLL